MIKNVCIAASLMLGLSGCASNFTSITPAETEGKYYITKFTAGFPVIYSDLYLCEAESNEKMICEEID